MILLVKIALLSILVGLSIKYINLVGLFKKAKETATGAGLALISLSVVVLSILSIN